LAEWNGIDTRAGRQSLERAAIGRLARGEAARKHVQTPSAFSRKSREVLPTPRSDLGGGRKRMRDEEKPPSWRG